MTLDALACTVRGCHEPLARGPRTLTCPRGHVFDIARQGYVNLLQPQDRRSPAAGDTAAALDARSRLLAAGVGAGILSGVVDAATALPLPPRPLVIDLGCGAGEALARLSTALHGDGIGVDLSVAAVERAARRFHGLAWVVANADRRLPLRDQSVHLAVSVHARRNPAECRRVLRGDGFLLVVVPATDDLVELRERIQGARTERDRATQVVAEHAGTFSLRARTTVREVHTLSGDALRDLLSGTYRGARRSERQRHDALDAMQVTVASDILTFAPSTA